MTISSAELIFYRTVEKEILGRIEDIKNALASGHVQDYADFRHKVGQIKALQDVLSWSYETNREIFGLPKDQN